MQNIFTNKIWIILVVLTGGVFFFLGSFYKNSVEKSDAPTDWEQQKINAVPEMSPKVNSAEASPKIASIDSLVNGLRVRLESEPNDMKGWILLSKSYQHLQRWDDAKYAMEKAKALGYEGESEPESKMPNDTIHNGMTQQQSIQENSTANKSLIEHIQNIQ